MSNIIKNRYRIEHLIGQGGMGEVFKAYDRLTTDTVALKQVTVPHKKLDILTRASETANERMVLANEFSTLSSLRHPNIISVLDYGFNDDNNPFYTMELLENGIQIREYAAGKTREQKINYLLGILQALRYLHQRGILHRDLKPANILVSDDSPKLLDFGLAVDADYAREHSDAAGTLAYLAPEILRGTSPSIQSDLYAFAVVAYEVFTGEHPFPYETQSELLQQVLLEVPRFPEHKLEDDIQPVLLRLLSKSPEDRYSSALDTIRALCDATNHPLPMETVEIRDSFLVASSFVGRDEEIKTLKNALKQTLDKKGQGYLIGGESGVGKTRLMDELRAQALVEGVSVVRGQAVTEAGLPYKIWQDILPYLLLLSDIADDEASILAIILPNISALLEREIKKTTLPASTVKTRLPILITNLMLEAAKTKPLLIMFEDLQWASDSIEILKQAINAIDGHPVMIVGNYRSDEAPHLADELQSMSRIQLERLSEEDIEKLSAAMLGDNGNAPGVVDLIHRESEGNAFFIVEVVRALADEVGQLSNIGLATLPAQVFAGGIQKIINRRLAKLPEWALHPVQISSIIGRRIQPDLMKQILPELNVEKWITICGEVAIFSAMGIEWEFTHDKIREFVIADLESDVARTMNLQVAEAIETLYADKLSDYAAMLSNYYYEGGKVEKESHYAAIAAEALRELNAPEAMRFAKRAIKLESYQYADDRERAFAALHLTYGQLGLRLSEFDQAKESFDRALDTYKQLDDTDGIALAKNSIGEWGLITGKFKIAEENLNASLPVLKDYKGDPMLYAHANMNMAVVQNRLGNTEVAFQHNVTCFEIAKRVGDEITIAKSLNNLAILKDMAGDWDEALEMHNQALEIRRRLKDRAGIASSLINMAAIEGDKENFDIQKSYLLEAIPNSRAVGQKRSEAYALRMLGDVETGTGNRDAAISYYQEAIRLAESINIIMMQVGALLALGGLYFKEDSKSQALDVYYDALERSIQIDFLFDKLEAVNKITNILIDREDKVTLVQWLCAAIQSGEKYRKKNELEERLESLKSQLDSDSYETACSEGQKLDIDTLAKDMLEHRKNKNEQ